MSPLRLNGSTSGNVTLDAPAVSGNNTLVLPANNGTTGQFLQTNGSGGLGWADALGSRNRIINGDMRIDQRNGGASVTSTYLGTFSVDRFASYGSGGGVYTTQRSTDVPAGQGFVNSIINTVTTTDSPTGADYYLVEQSIEGFNSADLEWGTASAKSVTISFFVKSSLTGTYTVALRNNGQNRSYRATYTINSANTWEQKTITVTGDTTGTWLTDNGRGISVGFTLGAGSDFISTGNTWSASDDFAATGQTQWIGTNGATFLITGLQLETGLTATPFERRSYGQELSLCQRYFVKLNDPRGRGVAGNVNAINRVGGSLPVPMRIAPNISMSGTIYWFDGTGTGTVTSLIATYSTHESYEFDATFATGTTATYRPISLFVIGAGTYSISASAEL